eukprot:maker-scaffold254_size236139-snap-gene-0.9 protein:Tk02050 transcript:maker-scaffold254_size236139-snap-gene-0.9-mRNA-1 annotation:"tbc1 domain family member 24 isoform x4"
MPAHNTPTDHGGQLQSVVDQTLLASLPDHGDHVDGTNEGETSTLELAQIPRSLEKDAQSIKMLIRSQHGLSLHREERTHLWMGLYEKKEGQDSAQANRVLFQDSLETCFGSKELPKEMPQLPSAVESSHLNSFCLTRKGKISTARILVVFIYNNPDIQFAPALYPLTAIIRHYLSEEDTYGLISSLSQSRQPKYLSLTQQQLDVDWRMVKELNQKYNKQVCTQLEVSTVRKEDVDELFQNWIWWILDYLPFPHVVRIMDCFLVEGQKVLIRCCLSVLRQFSKQLKTNPSLKSDIKKQGLNSAFIKFCQEIPVSPSVILERAFRFRGLSRSSMDKMNLRIEIDLKAKGFSSTAGKSRTHSGSGLPSPKALDEIRDVSDTLTRKQFVTIWQWMPERMSTIDPKLVYSSNEHGISLTTFYHKSEQYEPTILLIRTTGNEVFGAYCSTSWAERNYKDDKGMRQTYFGTGESFLFQIDLGDPSKCVKYAWVNADGSVTRSEVLTKAEQHARELFMSGQHDMIAIGGGGGNGIYLDSSLTFGKSERCATFNNPPLCKDGDFEVAVIEVYGLNYLDL